MKRDNEDYRKFVNKNSGFDLMRQNPDAICTENYDLSGVDRESVITHAWHLKTINNLHQSDEVKDALIGNGFSSSTTIFQTPKREFINSVKDEISQQDAEKIYEKAAHNYLMTSHFIAGLKTTGGSGYYKAMNRSMSGAGAAKRFENLPSYQDIFGDLDYCKCEECKSIFGPAAYFVDLLRIAEKHIILDDEQCVKLAERRPDLYNIELSCKNTNEQHTYLKIVNEIIVTYLKAKYSNGDDPYKKMAQARFPFNLPFYLPLEQIRISVKKQYGIQLDDIYEVWLRDDVSIALEIMKVSAKTVEMLTAPINEKYLPEYFGVDKIDMSALSQADYFCYITGLNMDNLHDLFMQGLDENEKTNAPMFFINRGLSNGRYLEVKTVGKTVTVTNMNADTLERIYRFVKISGIFGLSYDKTDWLLKVMGDDASKITEYTLVQSAKALKIMKRLDIGFYDFMSLIGNLKRYGNDNQFKAVYGDYVPKGEHWRIDEDSHLSKWLSASLNVEVHNLQWLSKFIMNGDVMHLTPDNLSALYRHCKMATILSMPIPQYIILLELCGMKQKRVFTPLDIQTLFDMAKLDVYKVAYVITGRENRYVKAAYTEESLTQFISYLRSKATESDAKDAKQYVTTEIASFLNIDKETVDALSLIMEKAHNDEYWADKFLNEETPAEYISGVMKCVSRWLVLHNTGVSVPVLKSVAAGQACYGISDINVLTIHNILNLNKAESFINAFRDTEYRLLDYFASNRDYSILADVSGWDEDHIKTVSKMICVNRQCIVEELESIKKCFDIMDKLNADIPFIKTLISLCNAEIRNYDEISKVAAGILTGINGAEVYPAIESVKRDALLSLTLYLLQKEYTNVDSYNHLYKYFLTDVQMDDKTQISYIKEGINAVQLYFQRCRMGLERGVIEVDIPDSWWAWIMDYRMWEANRKIFVYPESYLIPSVRHTKTRLFKDFEEAMAQSQITAGYTEEQYIKYLDNLAELTRLKPCGAYVAEVNKENTLFLFAKTEQQPHKYYYCKRVGYLAWGEWQKIDAAIESDNISPIFVFNRLHIFWPVIKKTSAVKLDQQSSGFNSTEQISYTVNIYYTYLNLQGNWVPPQTLVAEEFLYYKDTGSKIKGSEYADAFDLEKLHWKKVSLLRIGDKNAAGFVKKGADFEALVISFGPFRNNSGAKIEKLNNSGTDNGSDKEKFIERLNDIIGRNNVCTTNAESGYFSTGIVKIFNQNFEEENLSRKSEFVVLDGYIPNKHALIYTPIVDNIHKTAGVMYSNDVLNNTTSAHMGIMPHDALTADNAPVLTDTSFVSALIAPDISKEIFACFKNSGIIDKNGRTYEERFLSMDLLETLSPLFVRYAKKQVLSNIYNSVSEIQNILLRNVGGVHLFGNAERASVMAVGNQPGWFIFDCGDEAFMVHPKTEADDVSRTGDALKLSYHQVSYVTFMKMGFDKAQAVDMFECLRENGYIQSFGIVNTAAVNRAALSSLLKERYVLKDVLIDSIYLTLQGYPIVNEDMFTNIPGFSARDIFNKLIGLNVASQIVDFTGTAVYRLDLEKVRNLAYMQEFRFINQKAVGEDALKEILDRLLNAPTPVHVNYCNTVDVKLKLTERKFTIQRLTNSSLKKLQRKLANTGIDGFLTLETQSEPKTPVLPFDRLAPGYSVVRPKATDGVMVDYEGLYAEYNWELFYHIPMLIAESLKANGLHEASMKWFHYVFNPLHKGEKGYWNFKPFTEPFEEQLKSVLSNEAAIRTYNDHPFNPHAIANLRIGAYEKYTVIEYVSNFIQWGDMYFTLNTWESLTAASMMYVLASDLLGDRPKEVGERKPEQKLTFAIIKEKYGKDIPQFLVEYEQYLQENPDDSGFVVSNDAIPFNDIGTYFGIPENEHLLTCWDIVEDRLYKLRNSLDINGRSRVTKLFESPISVLDLVKAAAAAGSVISDYTARQAEPHPYRFGHVIEQAKNLTNYLIQLGNGILAAIEKKDSEALLLLSSNQERIILDMMTSIKQNQIDELLAYCDSLEVSKSSALNRQKYYQSQIDVNISPSEQLSLASMQEAAIFSSIAGAMKTAASIGYAAPQVGSPLAMTYGGAQIGATLNAIGEGFQISSNIASFVSQRSLTMANYARRRQEWGLQKEIAEYDVQNIESSLLSVKEKIAAANTDLQIHKKTIKHKEEVFDYMKSKFTGEQLYQWMIGRLSASMWQAYQLSLELSVTAQQAYQYERNVKDTFIKFDYWDGAKKGLLAGEGLMLALNQMQQSYMKKDERRLEIEKNISLALTYPKAFLELKSTGVCEFKLDEALFALDYPGCYCRRIVSVSISIPAILGPYQTIKALLRQNDSDILLAPDSKGIDYLLGIESQHPGANIVEKTVASCKDIAISRGIDDNGMFSFDFNDGRYYPFEGTGTASCWRLEMPKETNRFDFDSISDVIINVKYTALEGGEGFKDHVMGRLKNKTITNGLYYNIRRDFGCEWNLFMDGEITSNTQTLEFSLTSIPLGYFKKINIAGMYFKLDSAVSIEEKASMISVVTPENAGKQEIVLKNGVGGVVKENLDLKKLIGKWSVHINLSKAADFLKDGRLDASKFKNIELILVCEGSLM